MTKTIHKKAPLILAEIKKAKHILLHCHPSADPDSVGSALAMKFAIEQLGRKVILIKGDNDIPEEFVFPGIETIINKNFFEIDINDFDLFIILDSGSKDMISKEKEVIFPDSLMTVVIDHHVSNKGYGKINCIESAYPATSQILFHLFKEMNIEIDHDIALNLFMGIYADTGGLKYPLTTSETFKIVGELVSLAPEFTKTISIMENSKTKEDLIFLSLALASLKTYFSDRFALASITYEEFLENKINPDLCSPSEISTLFRTVKTFDISVCLTEVKPNIIKINFRSKDSIRFDVSKIAVAIGGGGHKAASGAHMKNITIPEAIDLVVKKAKEIYNL